MAVENQKSQRLHLLIICKSFPPDCCGVGDYTYLLAKNLVQHNHMKVSVITSVNSQCTTIDHVEIFPIVANWNLRSVNVIMEKIQQLSPQQILWQYVPYLYHRKGIPLYLCILFWRLRRWKTAVFFHEVAIEISPNIKRLCIATVQRFIAYAMCKTSNHIIVSNECVARFLGEKHTQLIHIGSNIPRCSLPQNTLQQLRSEIVGKCDLLFAIFGNIRSNHELLPVLKKLSKQQISWKLILIGNYQNTKSELFHREVARLQLQEHIYITGYVSVDLAAQYLAMSDIFLIWESPHKGIFLHSGALCAAFANSLVVVSSHGELTDRILHEESGAILLDNLCAQTLITCFRNVHSNREFRKKIKKKATTFFRKYLCWKVVCKKHRDLFQ